MIRTSSFGISSSPLRIREIKDKVDAAHRSSRLPEPYKKPQQSTSVNQIRGNPLFKSSVDSNTSSLLNVMDKGKIISRSVQETSSLRNLQRKEGSALDNNRSLLHKEPKQVTPKQSINSQQSSQKKGYIRNFANGSSGVLRQNNEKQNCISHKDRSTSKASISNQKSRKALPIDGSAGPSKIVNKVFVNSENGSKQVVSATTVSEKRPSLARLKNISRDKELVSKFTEFDKSITDLVLTNNNERDIRDLFIKTATDQRKDMNVISFTFTSPIKKYGSTSQSCHEVTKTNGHCSIDSYDLNHECNSKASLSSPSRLNFVGGDSLGFLLEQKLKEFTDGVEASHSDTIAENTSIDSTSNDPDSVSVLNFVSTTLVDKDVWPQTHDPTVDRKWKEFEGAEGHSSSSSTNKCEGRREVDLGRLKASINEGSNSHTSCLSSNSTGNEQYFLQSSQEMKGYTSSENSHKIKHEIDLSDRASSKCFEGWGTTKHSSTSQSCQEFEYVRRVLCYAGLKELLSPEGSSSNIISPGIFDQLENTIFSQENNMEEEPSKIGRKLLFDYVNDCFSLRHGELFLGSYKAWDKWEMYLQNKGWLAAELLEGISCLKRMGNLMLDELIEKDMSSGYGKWMGFEVEILEDGMEIGRQIEDSLVDELIVNLSLSYNFF
ncbi:hypothetical protein Nepgr_012272 [Nepenthes gracilis]|uniref:DUF4378 domain-containing protein n=1 Tax=Nepenthes gracilis TaxID=150966 RepID=A0AAD3SGP1_NEPGR|nr:hypothetical protein Nepgr_012272 [Nepenthes gracilis]